MTAPNLEPAADGGTAAPAGEVIRIASQSQPAGAPAALAVSNVSKSFPGVRALADVNLTCDPGEIHALVGENGSGKSTLIKVASGALVQDSGTVRIGGKLLRGTGTLSARQLGLLTAYQDGSLVQEMTVAENVILSYPGVRRLDFFADRRGTQELLKRYDLPYSADTPITALSPAGRQLLEVVKALAYAAHVLLLDEPTAALDSGNIARLETMLKDVAAHGTAILYISHRLDEVKRLADKLSVLRDGVIQGTYDRSEDWDVDQIVSLMVGVSTDLSFPVKGEDPGSKPVVLSTKNFVGKGFSGIDLHVRAGEIVGVAGAEGNGQHELVRALSGIVRGTGSVTLGDKRISLSSPAEALKSGIVFMSGDRAAESIFADMGVIANVTMRLKDELGPAGIVLRRNEKRIYNHYKKDMTIAAAVPEQPISSLSGGNQQKVVLARTVSREVRVLILDDPTQGVDARSRLEIYRHIRAQAGAGAAVVVASSDSAELAGLCDRVYAISRGQFVAELAGDEVTEPRIVDAFVNAKTTAVPMEADSQSLIRRAVRGVQRTLGKTWTPPVVLTALIILLAAFTASRSSAFLTSFNLGSLLILALPLAIVAMGQQAVLFAGAIDASVGSVVSLSVVVASFTMTSPGLLRPTGGLLVVLLVGLGVGIANSFVVQVLGVSPLIATIGMLGVVSGIAIILRPAPGGVFSSTVTELLSRSVGFVPIAFIVVLAVTILAEIWIRRTTSGLIWRATGLNETSVRRTGVRVTRVKVFAFIVVALSAAVAGVFLASQVTVGSNAVGVDYVLTSFTACFLGGASLHGGRGSFVGTFLGALLLSVIINATPLLGYPQWPSQVAVGALTILAVSVYVFARPGEASGRTQDIGSAHAAS